MQNRHRLCFILICSILIVSCNAYKDKQQKAALSFPELGSIVKSQGNLFYSSAEQVGIPHWSNPLKIQAQQLPFNKVSYDAYSNYVLRSGTINSIAYRDSLRYKPKYIRLRILDKIALTDLLNAEKNNNVKSYLENDKDYKIVTAMNFTVPETVMPSFLQAETILLQQDTFKKTHLVLINGKQEQKVAFSEIQVFGYEYSSFCWGEDRYHNKKIEAIVSNNEKCAKGTFKKASKVNSNKAYLKF